MFGVPTNTDSRGSLLVVN